MELTINVIHSFEKPDGTTQEILVRIHNRQEELFKFIANQFSQLNQKIMGFADDLDAKLSAIEDKLSRAAADSAKIKQGVEDLKTSITNSNLTADQQATLTAHADKILGAVSDLDTGLEGIDTTSPAAPVAAPTPTEPPATEEPAP